MLTRREILIESKSKSELRCFVYALPRLSSRLEKLSKKAFCFIPRSIFLKAFGTYPPPRHPISQSTPTHTHLNTKHKTHPNAMKSDTLLKLIFAIAALFVALVAADAPPAAEDAQPKLRVGILKKVPASQCKRKARAGDLIQVDYTGTLLDGTVFDSSLKPGRTPLEFGLGLGQVIPGWDRGLLGMCIGEKRKLTIPSHLAYGKAGAGGVIPPDATLIFTTELKGIVGYDPKEDIAKAEEKVKTAAEKEVEDLPEPETAVGKEAEKADEVASAPVESTTPAAAAGKAAVEEEEPEVEDHGEPAAENTAAGSDNDEL
jgi:hypothetical protein